MMLPVPDSIYYCSTTAIPHPCLLYTPYFTPFPNFHPPPNLHSQATKIQYRSQIPLRRKAPDHIPKVLHNVHRNRDRGSLPAARPVAKARIPTIVQTVYKKLLSNNITVEELVLRQTGYDGIAPTKMEELDLNHPMVKSQVAI